MKLPNNLVLNEPNAAHLFESLRYSGYSNVEAIADILDNSFDASANNIWIEINANDKKEITIDIYDDGTGMSKQELDEALKLGSNADKSLISDLGKAGLGLKTAGTSIARCIEVFTRRKSESVYYSCYDGDLINEYQQWVKKLNEIPKNEIDDKINIAQNIQDSVDSKKQTYYRVLDEHGTIIRLKNCDRLTYSAIGHFVNALKKHLGEVFRKYIDANKNIYINKEKIDAIDPLCISGTNREKLSEDPDVSSRKLKINLNNKQVAFEVKVSILPKMTDAQAKLLQINMNNQGFYVIRNNRQIARAQTLDIITKHNSSNRIRMEIIFDGTQDEEMGLNFLKNNIHPKNGIIDAIEKDIINPIFVPAKNKAEVKERIETAKSSNITHANVEKTFAKKGNILIKPFVKTDSKENLKKTFEKIIQQYPKQITEEDIDLPLKIVKSEEMNEKDEFYQCSQAGETTIVELNLKHPFVEQILALEDDARDKMEFLIGSFAIAELRLNEEQQTFFRQHLLHDVSLNLIQLIS